MNNSPQLLATANETPSDVNKSDLYPMWGDSKKWQDALYRSVCCKALDVPEDSMGDVTTGMKSEDVVKLVEALQQKQQAAIPTQPSQQQQPAASQAPTSTLSKWARRAAVVALPLAGAAGVWGWNAITADNDKPPAIEQPAGLGYTDSRIESTVKVRPPEETP